MTERSVGRLAGMLAFVGLFLMGSLPLPAGDKDKKTTTKIERKSLVRLEMDKDKQVVTGVEIAVFAPISKENRKPTDILKKLDVDSKTQFVLVDGDKKTSFDQKTVLSDPQAKGIFVDSLGPKKALELSDMETKGNVLVSATVMRSAAKSEAAAKEEAKKESKKDKK